MFIFFASADRDPSKFSSFSQTDVKNRCKKKNEKKKDTMIEDRERCRDIHTYV